MSQSVVYTGRDLEAMAFAENYHRWIVQFFRPHLGARLVEVGAGTGSFSALLRQERGIESLSLVEPSRAMYEELVKQVKHVEPPPRIETYNAVFASVAASIKLAQEPDSIIYVNVLEHIADDEAELELVHQTLADGGRIFVFVPALQWLLGAFDREIGHFRRYTKTEIESKCRRAGFKIICSRYLDFFGIAPWWVKYRLMKSNRLEPRAVMLYDKYVVPFAKTLESIVRPPLGKNVLLVAEKS